MSGSKIYTFVHFRYRESKINAIEWGEIEVFLPNCPYLFIHHPGVTDYAKRLYTGSLNNRLTQRDGAMHSLLYFNKRVIVPFKSWKEFSSII